MTTNNPSPSRRKFLSTLPLATIAIPASLAGVGGGSVGASGVVGASEAAKEPPTTPQDHSRKKKPMGIFKVTRHFVLHIPYEAMAKSRHCTNSSELFGFEPGSLVLLSSNVSASRHDWNGVKLSEIEYTFAALDGPSSKKLADRADFSKLFEQPSFPVANTEGVTSVEERAGDSGHESYVDWFVGNGLKRHRVNRKNIKDAPEFVQWVVANCEKVTQGRAGEGRWAGHWSSYKLIA